MKTVFKYPLGLGGTTILHKGAEILSMQVQHGIPCVWALVDPDEKDVDKKSITVFGTGHPIDDNLILEKFIGTFQLNEGKLVFHVFETKTKPV